MNPFSAAFSLLLAAGAATGFKLVPSIYDSSTETTVCTTPACVEAAANFLHNMNASADPCQDFQQYACGGFIAKETIPDEKSSISSSFYPISEEIYKRGRLLLEEEVTDMDWETDKMTKELYASCMDMNRRDELGAKPLVDLLQEVIGGWPAIEGDDWKEENFDWVEAVYKLKKMGFSGGYLMDASIGQDLGDPKKNSFYLSGPSLGLSRDFLIEGMEHKKVKFYRDHMVNVAEYLGGDREVVQEHLEKALKFEIQLANRTLSKEQKRNISIIYNEYTLDKIPNQEGHPKSWMDFFQGCTRNQLTEEIKEDERVIVTDKKYFELLAPLLNATPKRVLADFFAWRIASGTMSTLGTEARAIYHKYRKASAGVQRQTPLWKVCTSVAGINSRSSSSLRIAAGSMYVRRHFPEEAKGQMEELVDYLKDAFKGILESIDWMDETTRERALHKLSVMNRKIAYPEELVKQEVIEEYFKGYEVDTKDYLGSILRLKVLHSDYNLKQLREPVDPDHWLEFTSVALVNAFADLTANSIKFPAGILQGVFFNKDVPKYMNFAAIGGVIGHEITHNFDDIGKQFDETGKLVNWWEPKTLERFTEKSRCIIEQYGNFTHPQVNISVNGINTQGENIADNGGIKQAYIAYNEWAEENPAEPQLPGLGLTAKQMFWLGWSNNWCYKAKNEYLENLMKVDSHAPAMFRINGPLVNSPEFAKDFNCPAGSNMNPEKKCNVW